MVDHTFKVCGDVSDNPIPWAPLPDPALLTPPVGFIGCDRGAFFAHTSPLPQVMESIESGPGGGVKRKRTPEVLPARIAKGGLGGSGKYSFLYYRFHDFLIIENKSMSSVQYSRQISGAELYDPERLCRSRFI